MEEDAPIQQSRTAFITSFFAQVDHYKRLLIRYWWIPFLAVGISGGIQWFLLKRVKPYFVSVGRMIVNVKLSIPDANVYSEDVNNFLGTQVELMKSDSILNRVNAHLRTANPGVQPKPVDVNVGLLPKSSIFDLRASGLDPAYTQAYLEATMEEYINLKKDLFANASTATQSSMEDKLKQMAVELEKSKEDVINYQSTNDFVSIQAGGGNSAAEYLLTLTRDLAEHKSALDLLNSLTPDQNLQNHDAAPRGPVPGKDVGVSQKPNLATTPAHTDTANDQIPPNLGDREEAYLTAREQLRLLQAKRDALTNSQVLADKLALPGVEEDIAQQVLRLDILQEQSQEKLENRRHILEQEIHNLEGQVKEWEAKSLLASRKLSEFEALKDKQKRLQTIYDGMQANLQTLDVDKGIGQESVTILDPATPAVRVSPEKLKRLIMAGMIGLFLGVGIVVFLDRLDDRPGNFNELEQLFDMPVLGQFPLMKAKKRSEGVPILQLDDDRYPVIEAFRSLRSALVYRDPQQEQPRSIVISSAGPNDGKSMVSANLAVTLAQTGARVLLIDADVRRGVLHKHFSLPACPGLAEVLAGRCAWSTVVEHTSIPNLHLLPCGKSPRQSVNLFATAGKLLTEMAGHYDYYLFDTAPVMVGDDVLSLAPHVDGLIMVIRAGFTSGRVVQTALDSLQLRRVKVLGLVFNAVHPKTSDYYYYRSKDYYPPHPAA